MLTSGITQLGHALADVADRVGPWVETAMANAPASATQALAAARPAFDDAVLRVRAVVEKMHMPQRGGGGGEYQAYGEAGGQEAALENRS